MAVLTHVDDWQFDAFQLASVTGGRPLTALSYLLFRQSEIIDKWALDEHKLVKYLMRIEDGCVVVLWFGSSCHGGGRRGAQGGH